jgi:hypothetical protein
MRRLVQRLVRRPSRRGGAARGGASAPHPPGEGAANPPSAPFSLHEDVEADLFDHDEVPAGAFASEHEHWHTRRRIEVLEGPGMASGALGPRGHHEPGGVGSHRHAARHDARHDAQRYAQHNAHHEAHEAPRSHAGHPHAHAGSAAHGGAVPAAANTAGAMANTTPRGSNLE